MQELIQEFIKQKKFAVIGATDNPEKYGNQIVKNLKKRGYDIFPVNPRLKEVEGITCYPSLSAVPEKVDVVDLVVPPAAVIPVLQECVKQGIRSIWMQPGSESSEAIDFCKEHNLDVVHDVCVMMN